MKFLLVATVVTLAFFASQVDADLDSAMKAIPVKIKKILFLQTANLSQYSLTQIIQNRYDINFTLNGFELELNKSSLIERTLGGSTVQVSFDMLLNDLSLQGSVEFNEKYSSYGYRGELRTIFDGIIKIQIDTYYNVKTSTLIIKNYVISYAKHINDFNWSNCASETNADCLWTESRTARYLREEFPDQLKIRIHQVLYEAVPKMAKELSYIV